MAYDPKFMSLLGPSSGGQLWSYYHPTDLAAQIKATNYFQPIWYTLDPGDVIHCHAGGSPALFDLRVFNSISVNVQCMSTANYV